MQSNTAEEQFQKLFNDRATTVLRWGRKSNYNADPNAFKRYELTLSECRNRGVRFLPAQVMRPIFHAAGL